MYRIEKILEDWRRNSHETCKSIGYYYRKIYANEYYRALGGAHNISTVSSDILHVKKNAHIKYKKRKAREEEMQIKEEKEKRQIEEE